MKAKEKRDHKYWYDFKCEGCDEECDLGVPIQHGTPICCPAGCGATYVQWYPPRVMAALKCVVRPIYYESK